MTNLERLEREAADLEHAAASWWRRDTPVGQEHAAQLAGDIRTILAEHAALLAACKNVKNCGLMLDEFRAVRAAVALCREAKP